jgi:hypothetical protein
MEEAMRGEEGVVVAVDESESAHRTLEYVGNMVAGREGVRIRLLHLLPPYPRGVIEHGGAEDPEREVTLEREMQQARDEWLMGAAEDAEPMLAQAVSTLESCGVPRRAVETVCCEVTDEEALARKCLEVARASGYRTIAIGRSSLSWLRERFHSHPSDVLVRRGRGFTIWIVE